MKKLLIIAILLISTAVSGSQWTCGVKPIVPIGCADLICIDGVWRCINQ